MREYLIKVFDDTIRRIDAGEYKTDSIYCDKYNLTNHSISKGKNRATITVDNDDCINIASKLSKSGFTCMLNMASYKRPGGGVKKGAMAQEEELSRRSNLIYGLPEEWYPLSLNDYIYTQNVTFFKDRHYQIMDPFDCDVITMAAVNLNGLDAPHNYDEIMSKKISNMLYTPYENGCDNLVLSAFGCGVFKNDPHYVAGLFKTIMDSGFDTLYKRISFAILNDRNSVGSNYQIFKEVILK